MRNKGAISVRQSTCSAAITSTLFLVSASFVTLILLPKSLPLLKLGGFEFGWGIGDVLLIAVFLLSFKQVLLTGKVKYLYGVNSLDKVVLLYFIILLYPVIIGSFRYPDESIFIVAGYIKYSEVLMMYYLIRRTLRTERQATLLLKTFVVTLLGVLTVSIIQKMSPDIYLLFWETIGAKSRPFEESFISSIGWRLSGPFFNPNTLAQFLLLAIPTSWVAFSFQHKHLLRLFYLSVIILSIVIFILTQSRSGYLGFLFMLMFFIYHLSFKGKLKSAFLVIILIGIGLFYKPLLYHRTIEYTFRGDMGLGISAYERLVAWKTGICAIRQFWLAGSGFSESGAALKQYGFIGGVHNTFLRAWIEGGIIAFGTFVLLLWRIWSWRKAKLTEPWNSYKYALIAAFVGLVITGFLGDTFQNTKTMTAFMFLLAMLNSVYQLQKKKGNTLKHHGRIAYITAQAPWGRGETFIIDEMLALREAGVELLIIPRNPTKEVFHQEAQTLLENTVWLPVISPKMIGVLLISLLTKPRLWKIMGAIFRHSRTWHILAKNLAVVPKGVYIASLLEKRSIEHIHAHWGSTTATMAWVASCLSNIYWSFTLHRWDITENNLLREKVESAKFVRCISEHGKNELLEIIGKNYGGELKVIHMGVEVPTNIPKYEEKKSNLRKFTMVTPANLLEVKGHKYLIEACSVLINRGVKNFQCIFYGEGPLRTELEALIEEKGLNNYIKMPGAIPHEKLMMEYKNREVDVVILPSITTDKGEHEGIPIALMEAMAYGIPVISTNTGGIPELLSAGAGIMVEEKNSRQLADAIQNLIKDAGLARKISQAGYERVKEHFNIYKNVVRLLELIKQPNRFVS